jgi:ribosomal protein S18 acetylase RimI-like enzyme
MTDEDLYRRSVKTLLTVWQAMADDTPAAALIRGEGFAAAVFPDEPRRSVYNNAVLDPEADLDALEDAYAGLGVDRYAAWVREGDEATRTAIEARGYRIEETTRVMGMSLDDVSLPRPQLDLTEPHRDAYADFFRREALDPGLVVAFDAFRVLIATSDGDPVTSAIAYDHDGDCGIFNVSTLEHARRRGLGTAITALHLHDARERGCATASLQSTPMAERVYAAAGFRDLGRYLELVPSVVSR